MSVGSVAPWRLCTVTILQVSDQCGGPGSYAGRAMDNSLGSTSFYVTHDGTLFDQVPITNLARTLSLHTFENSGAQEAPKKAARKQNEKEQLNYARQ
eukprot:6484556-Amphidinium_carterae.2